MLLSIANPSYVSDTISLRWQTDIAFNGNLPHVGIPPQAMQHSSVWMPSKRIHKPDVELYWPPSPPFLAPEHRVICAFDPLPSPTSVYIIMSTNGSTEPPITGDEGTHITQHEAQGPETAILRPVGEAAEEAAGEHRGDPGRCKVARSLLMFSYCLRRLPNAQRWNAYTS